MLHYEKRNGDYVLVSEFGTIKDSMNEVAILLSVSDDGHAILQKHGRPELVESHMQTMITKFNDAGFTEMASELRVVKGKFPIKVLDKLMNCSGYATKFYLDVTSGKLLPENIDIPL